ncbi:MAG TPA: hypothetical protein PK020_21025 [Ilumatobacteraceae bacterium]|nr:hypothetical protein [Ilumatobacteraceae bacterium]HRB04138.1 hypothetical protein [Ilumatobacteraceae bacterium]
MTENHENSLGTALSRRRLIGAAGLGAVGIATASTATTARADEIDPNNDASGNPRGTGSGELSAQAVPPLTPGYSYFTGSQFDFHSNSSNQTNIRVITADGAYAPSSFIVCPLHIPAGVRVREVTIFAKIGPAAKSAVLEGYDLDDVGVRAPYLVVALPANTTLAMPVTVACDFTIDPGKSYDLAMYTADANAKMFAFRIGYQAAAAFVPIAPYRAYDSRKAGVPTPGIMPPNTSRVVSVVNAIDDGGVISTPNVIPSTARAITYNLTATGTTGDNYLAIAPGLVASTTVSAINFGANQSIANAGTVTVDNGTVKVFCGNNVGSSHFIIDITGYYI